ncbi:hypothetical protein BH09PAT2_BH09PAT2_03450 [soil metagenome]
MAILSEQLPIPAYLQRPIEELCIKEYKKDNYHLIHYVDRYCKFYQLPEQVKIKGHNTPIYTASMADIDTVNLYYQQLAWQLFPELQESATTLDDDLYLGMILYVGDSQSEIYLVDTLEEGERADTIAHEAIHALNSTNFPDGGFCKTYQSGINLDEGATELLRLYLKHYGGIHSYFTTATTIYSDILNGKIDCYYPLETSSLLDLIKNTHIENFSTFMRWFAQLGAHDEICSRDKQDVLYNYLKSIKIETLTDGLFDTKWIKLINDFADLKKLKQPLNYK